MTERQRMRIVGFSDGYPEVTLEPVDGPSVPPIVKPPASGEWLEEITSDDGESKAYLIRNPGDYVLDRDINTAETAIFFGVPGINLDLGGHFVKFGGSYRPGCVGINPIKTLSKHAGFGNNDQRFSKALADVRWRDGTSTIRNGVITGNPDAKSSHHLGIGGDYVHGIALDGVTVDCFGPDAACVRGGSVKVSNCRTNLESRFTANRHQLPGNVIITESGLVENSSIRGGNNGIVFKAARGKVQRTFVSNDAFDTNGYGIHCYKCEGVETLDSWIIPRNGRGFMMGGSPDGVTPLPTIVKNNFIFAMERPNDEFGYGLEPCCLRSRYNVDQFEFTGNTCLAVGGNIPGGDELTAAMGIYLTNKPGSLSNRIHKNKIMAMLLGEVDYTKNHTAAAIGLIGEGNYGEGTPWECADVIEDNKLVSNCHMACLSHGDGGCNMRLPVTVSKMRWETSDLIAYEFFIELLKSMAELHADDQELVGSIASKFVKQLDPKNESRAYFDVGRSGGSRGVFVAGSIDYSVAPVSSRSRRYAFDVTLNDTRYKKDAWSNEVTALPSVPERAD